MAPKPETLTRPKAPDTLALRTKTPQDVGFEELLTQLRAADDIQPAAELGDGYEILRKEDKGRLVGVPFILQDWHLYDGDFGPAVSLRLMTKAGERYIINDGSTGIRDQLLNMKDTLKAIYFIHGLRRSDYEYTDPKTQEKKQAVTFYLDFSA